MNHAPRPRLLGRFGRAAAWRSGPDLADMGTAFALDEALERGAPFSQAPVEALTRPHAVPVARWRLWLGRKLGA